MNLEPDKTKHYLCQNCDEEIEYGPVGYSLTRDWRHVKTRLAACNLSAVPSLLEV